MAFSMLINGVEFACNVRRDTISIRESLQANGSSMTAKVQLNGALTAPLAGQLIQFYRDGELEFAGRIASVDQDRDWFVSKWMLACQDFTPDFDAELLKQVYASQNTGSMIREIVQTVGKGFTANNVATSAPDAPEFDADYEQPSSVVSRLSEAIEYQWYIDYARDMHFFYVRDRAAPVTTIDFDADVDGVYSNLTINEDASQVKNVIYLKGAKIRSPFSDAIAFKADGDQRFVPLNYQPVSIRDEDITVQVNGMYMTVELDGEQSQAGDDGAASLTVYLCLDNWGVRWPDQSPPGEDSEVSVAYRYVLDPVILTEDPDSIAFMAARENHADAPSNGRHEATFQVPELGILDSDQLVVDYGQLLLTRYAYPVYTLSFESKTQGWHVGQNFFATSTRWGFDNKRCFVTGLTKTIYQSSDGVAKFRYQVEASTSPFPT